MEIQPEFIDNMDFYMFQSGHNAQFQNRCMPYRIPEYFKTNYPAKPLINSEPCYEQMGCSGKMYGRFHQFDIRRAAWQSILSGADAGVTYGTAGIYSWHTFGNKFETEFAEGFDTPNPWQLALHYPGAWDYSDIKHILGEFVSKPLVPRQEIMLNDTEEIRLAMTEDENTILIYAPENTSIRIEYVLHQDTYELTIIDLETRHREVGVISCDGKVSTIGIHSFNHDVLCIIERNT